MYQGNTPVVSSDAYGLGPAGAVSGCDCLWIADSRRGEWTVVIRARHADRTSLRYTCRIEPCTPRTNISRIPTASCPSVGWARSRMKPIKRLCISPFRMGLGAKPSSGAGCARTLLVLTQVRLPHRRPAWPAVQPCPCCHFPARSRSG